MQDMETRKENQDMLVEKERLASLGQMIGGIAHNLKTPIMSIAGATEGLSGGTSHNRNLKIKGDLLIHYDTTIAERADSKIIINDTHYSLQSSKLQKILRETVPKGKQVLLKDVEK